MTLVFGDTGTLVLRHATVKVTRAQVTSGELPIGTAKCDGAQRACRFTTSGTIDELGARRAVAARVLHRSSVTVPAGGKRLVTLKLNRAERTSLRHGKRLRAMLTVAASADGADAVSAQRTITIQPR